MNTVIAFVVIFGALVFFHELGHLVFAKRAGILCREFAIGFGPKIFSFKRDETVYTIRLLPLGGFVRMAGEDPEMIEVKPGQMVGLMFDKEGKVNKVIINNKEQHPNAKVIEVEQADLEHNLFISGYEEGEDERLQKFEVAEESYFVMDGEEIQIAPYSRQFASKTLGQRALAIFAGPLMNFILAFVIFIVLGISQGYVVDKPVMGKLTSDGVAVDAGLKQGDKVQAIDGQSVSTWDDVVKVIQKHPEQQITFTVQRGGKTLDIPITPESRKVGEQTIG